jgi:hypothetical protein
MSNHEGTFLFELKSKLPLLFVGLVLFVSLGKSENMDDYVYILVAKNIARNLLDPYAGLVHWGSTYEPLFSVNENPPLFSYVLAMAGAAARWNIAALHLIVLPITLAGIIGTGKLASTLGANPHQAQWGLGLSALWLVSASTLMCDVMMVSLSVWAALCAQHAVNALERRAIAWAALAGVLAGLAFWTKFSAILVAAGLGLHLLLRGHTRRPFVLFSLVFLSLFVSFDVFTWLKYGESKFLDAILHTTVTAEGGSTPVRIATTLMLLGAGCLAMVATNVVSFRRRDGLVCVFAGMVATVLMFASHQFPVLDEASGPRSLGLGLHAWAFSSVGFAVVFLACSRRHIAISQPLLMLIPILFLLFSVKLNWCANARSVLPALPFLAVWLAMPVAPRVSESPRADRWSGHALLAACGMLAVLVLHGDIQWGETMHRAAQLAATTHADNKQHTTFAGHWGFQAALEEQGFRPLDMVHQNYRPGDIVVAQGSSAGQVLPTYWTFVDGFVQPIPALASTFSEETGAGFYLANEKMPFPFTLLFPYDDTLYFFKVETEPVAATR